MKKYIIAATIVLLAAGCSKQQPVSVIQYPSPQQTQPATTTPMSAAVLTVNDVENKYSFSIKYPAEFNATTSVDSSDVIACSESDSLACFYLNQSAYKGTNFQNAGVSVKIKPSLNTESKCYDLKSQIDDPVNESVQADVVINGVMFKSFKGTGAAAGTLSDVQVYNDFHTGNCYQIVQEVSYTNIGDYTTPIKEFNKKAVWQKLQGVVNTFEFSTYELQKISLPVKYNNSKYAFTFSLPADWKGYSVLTSVWSVGKINDSSPDIATSGPVIIFRNPNWTANKPYQDIPVMVFTIEQQAGLGVKYTFPWAGGIPKELGRNDRYIFVLQPRYNFIDGVDGTLEVDHIIDNNPLKAY